MEETKPINQLVSDSVSEADHSVIIQSEQQSQKSNFLAILLSVLLTVSVLIAGFFAYQTQKLVKELTLLRVEPTPTIEPVATESSEVDSTANWKTYTGKIFTFKYPGNMDVKRQDTQDIDDPKNVGDLVELSNNQYKLQVSSDFMGGWGGSVCLIYKDQEVDGHDSQLLYFRSSKPGTEICLDQYIDLVALIENHKFTHPYPVLVELKTQKDNGVVDLELFNQILSTFKFTDSAQITEETEVRNFADLYAKTFVAGDWVKLKTLLTSAIAKEMSAGMTNLPTGGYSLDGYKILTIVKETTGNYTVTIQFTRNGQPLRNPSGDPQIIISKENGVWKSMTWYLYQ